MSWIRRYQQQKKKRLFLNIQLIPILCFQVMYCYGHRHCSIDYSVELIIIDETCQTAFISHWNVFCLIPLGKCAPWRRATNRCKKFKFWSFWKSPYMFMKSSSMPLMPKQETCITLQYTLNKTNQEWLFNSAYLRKPKTIETMEFGQEVLMPDCFTLLSVMFSKERVCFILHKNK